LSNPATVPSAAHPDKEAITTRGETETQILNEEDTVRKMVEPIAGSAAGSSDDTMPSII